MQHHSKSYSVLEVLRLVQSGSLALPEFQRPFVWEPSRVLELLDSVLSGWPVGSLLLLEGPQPFDVRAIDGAPDLYRDEVKLFLLDGQQRVTALYHSLFGSSKTVYYADFTELDDDGRPTLRWTARKGFSTSQISNAKVPFEVILNNSMLEESMQIVGATASEWLVATRELLGDIDTGHQYLLPGIVMEQGISLEALTRIFETLNRTGVRLNSFDLMVAVLYPSGFKLRVEWERATAENKLLDEFDASGLELLKLIALWQRDSDSMAKDRPTSRKVTGIRQRDVLNIPPDQVEELWPRAVEAYVAALRFVRSQCGVLDGDSVPSETLILSVAYFLESGILEDKVLRWYWSAIATQSYAQGANTQILKDIRSDDLIIPSRDEIQRLLSVALVDENRRNKILRLGLRGLSVLEQDLDPVTGLPRRGPLVELSFSALVDNRVALDGSGSVAELLVVSKESAKLLRSRRLKSENIVDKLAVKTLLDQGFVSHPSKFGGPLDLSRRIELLMQRVLARIV